MNPRLSLQGRMSIDGWTGVSPGGPRATHGRQSSLYRSQTNTLFNAFDEHEHHGNTEAVGLRNLREDDETEEDEDDDDDLALKYDERSHLRKTKGNGATLSQPRSASRSNSHSPIHRDSSDVRIASR